jgi:F-type H+-transporting ATPase subunit epsilon
MHCYLNVISIEEKFFSGFILKMQVSGIIGDVGIYPGHSQLITIIKPGLLFIIDEKNNEEYFYLSGGILEVQPQLITILSDIFIRGIDLNKNKILNKKKEIEGILKENKLDTNKKKIFYQQLQQSVAKLKVIKMMNKSKIK